MGLYPCPCLLSTGVTGMCLLYILLGTEPRTLCVLGNLSTHLNYNPRPENRILTQKCVFCFIFVLFLVFSTQLYPDMTISATEIDLLVFQPDGLHLSLNLLGIKSSPESLDCSFLPYSCSPAAWTVSIPPSDAKYLHITWAGLVSMETDSPEEWNPVPNEACQAGGIVVWGLKGHSIFF